MTDLWQNLSAVTQDAIIFAVLLIPGFLLGIIVLRGYRPQDLVWSLLWRYRVTNSLFIVLMALSIGLGTALVAQERGIRRGMAKAADKFDLIIASPGSKMDMMLAAVYLQPIDAPLLDGYIMQEVYQDPEVFLAAPIAYGDSFKGYPVIGSTTGFIQHLTDDRLLKGRLFTTTVEAVVGARVSLEIGDFFIPAHGLGHDTNDDKVSSTHPSLVIKEAAISLHEVMHEHPDKHEHMDKHEHDENHHHHGFEIKVVGKMPMTGSPWDKAIIVAVESVWCVHGLGTGHKQGENGQIGPPFDPDLFPGTPAILVKAEKLWANYSLSKKYTRKDTMAFFPGTVLAKLYGLLGDIRKAMSMMAALSQVLVAAGILTGLVVLAKLFSHRFALLRAIGAPCRFIFAVMWSYTAVLITAGSILGLCFGYIATFIISNIITSRTDIQINVWLSWPEFHLAAFFITLTLFLALIPSSIAYSQHVIDDLRSK